MHFIVVWTVQRMTAIPSFYLRFHTLQSWHRNHNGDIKLQKCALFHVM